MDGEKGGEKSGVQEARISVSMSEEEYKAFSRLRDAGSLDVEEKPLAVTSEELSRLKSTEEEIRTSVIRLGLAQEKVGLAMSLLMDCRRRREATLLEIGGRLGIDVEKNPRWGVDLATGNVVLDLQKV